MRKVVLFVLGLLLVMQGWAQDRDKYVITGEMTGDSMRFSKRSVSKLYLTRLHEGREVNIDSVTVKNKRFKFEGIAPELMDVCFITGFDNGSVQLFLEPGTITILPFDAKFPVGAKVKGTPNNDVLYDFQQMHDRHVERVRKEQNEVARNIPDSIRSNEEAYAAYQNAAYFSNSLIYRIEVMKFVKNHIHAPAVLYIIKYNLYDMFTPKVLERQFLRALPQEMRTHPLYTDMLNQIKASNLKVGAPAPDIAGRKLDGKELKLSDLKGKYVLLDFWASWCGPCRREFPYIKQAMTASENKDNFVVLSYSIDDKRGEWIKCIEENALTHKNWIHISTLQGWSSPAVKLFNVTAVPRTVLLNPRGEVVAFDLRGEEMLAKVMRIMEGTEKYE